MKNQNNNKQQWTCWSPIVSVLALSAIGTFGCGQGMVDDNSLSGDSDNLVLSYLRTEFEVVSWPSLLSVVRSTPSLQNNSSTKAGDVLVAGTPGGTVADFAAWSQIQLYGYSKEKNYSGQILGKGPQEFITPFTPDSQSPKALGDINGDGYVDLISAHDFGRDWKVQLGQAKGFAKQVNASLGEDSDGTHVVATGDLNGDGFDDVVIGSENSKALFVYLGSQNGDVSLASTLEYRNPTTGYELGTRAIKIADLDGDSKADAIVALTAKHIWEPDVAEGANEAYLAVLPFDPKELASAPSGFSYLFDVQYTYLGKGIGEDLALGDFNQDGYSEAVVTVGTELFDGKEGIRTIKVVSGLNSTPLITSYAADQDITIDNNYESKFVKVGNVIGDDNLDIVVTRAGKERQVSMVSWESGRTYISIFPGIGNGEFGPAINIPLSDKEPTVNPWALAIGDVLQDNDGLDDIAVSYIDLPPWYQTSIFSDPPGTVAIIGGFKDITSGE